MNTNESQQRAARLIEEADHSRKVANDFLTSIKKGVGAKSTTGSSNSGRSSQMAKVQAAKARAAYAEQQAKLERKMAEMEEKERMRAATAERQNINLDIDMKLLSERKELAMAEAELCEATSEIDLGLPDTNPNLRTAEYVHRLYNTNTDLKPLNPDAAPFESPMTSERTTSDFTKFLLTKDILASRLSVFTDQPETFQAWKSTFEAVSREIGATPEEEIDLLIKWLGSNSKKQEISLKSAYAHDPITALAKAWGILNERFGSPETIYHSTVRKLDAFPNISLKDA